MSLKSPRQYFCDGGCSCKQLWIGGLQAKTGEKEKTAKARNHSSMGCLSSSRSDSALDRLSTGLKATRNQSWVILCVCTGRMLMSVMIFFLLETAPEVSDSKRAQLWVSLDAPHQVEFIRYPFKCP